MCESHGAVIVDWPPPRGTESDPCWCNGPWEREEQHHWECRIDRKDFKEEMQAMADRKALWAQEEQDALLEAELIGYLRGKYSEQDMEDICKYLDIIPAQASVTLVEAVFDELFRRACKEKKHAA